MKNKCPWCGKTNCVRSVVFNNVEQYGRSGSNFHSLPCLHCGKMIDVRIEKVMKVDSVTKSDKTHGEGNW